jgi:hypothetical protein
MRSLAVIGFGLGLVGCTKEPTLDGQVTDIWGVAVPEATVILDGVPVRATTDGHGYFSLPLRAGTNTLRVGKEGFVQEEVTVEVVAGEDPPSPIVELYPRPGEHGFYAVSQSSYTRLEPVEVHVLGSELDSVAGVEQVKTRVNRLPLEVIFDTQLRLDEIDRISLRLHKLEYVETVELPGAFGPQIVDAKLYVARDEIGLNVTPMKSRHAYQVLPERELEEGLYALHIFDVLDPRKVSDLDRVSRSQRVAWAFSIEP